MFQIAFFIISIYHFSLSSFHETCVKFIYSQKAFLPNLAWQRLMQWHNFNTWIIGFFGKRKEMYIGFSMAPNQVDLLENYPDYLWWHYSYFLILAISSFLFWVTLLVLWLCPVSSGFFGFCFFGFFEDTQEISLAVMFDKIWSHILACRR